MNTSAAKKSFVLPKIKSRKIELRSPDKKEKTAFRTVIWACVLLIAWYLLTHPRVSSIAINNALLFCLKTLIPSLFPFMIAGEILLASGFAEVCERWAGRIFSKLFGLNGKGVSAFIIGAFCGFPVGAKTAVSLFLSGDIEKKDAERLSGICNNAGLGFLISGVGAGIWDSTAFGVCLYISQLISAAITGILLFGTKKQNTCYGLNQRTESTSEKFFTLSGVLSNAISTAAVSMLKVIGFVVFFEVTLSVLSELLVSAGANLAVISLVSAFTEITAGTKSLYSLSLVSPQFWSPVAKTLTFTFSSFGGLSVYMQFCAFACPSGVGTKTYFKTKLIQSAVCTLLGLALVLLKVI